MKYIELTQGYFTKLDDEDYEKFSKFKWCVRRKPDGRVIAVRSQRDGKKFLNYQLHREIMNCPKGKVVDHINGNTLDNRRENLRICTIQQNSMNRSNQRTNKFNSKYKGVSWDKQRKKYFSRIYINGKAKILGRFKTEEEAALAYNEKAKEVFGEYAKLNNVEE